MKTLDWLYDHGCNAQEILEQYEDFWIGILRDDILENEPPEASDAYQTVSRYDYESIACDTPITIEFLDILSEEAGLFNALVSFSCKLLRTLEKQGVYDFKEYFSCKYGITLSESECWFLSRVENYAEEDQNGQNENASTKIVEAQDYN